MLRCPFGLVVPFVVAGVVLVAGCSSSNTDNGGGSAGATGGCKPTAAECYGAGPDGPGNACLAKADNTGDKVQLRLSQLQVSSPVALIQPFMQDAIITKKINLHQQACYQSGEAEFNILFELDTKAKTLTAGASIPQELIGAPKDGTCFAKFTDQSSGIDVGPVSTPFTVSGDTYSANFDKLVLPIYINPVQDSYALLPLHNVDVTATLSKDHDCVGSFRAADLQPPLCAPAEGEFAWVNGGGFDAYITVAEADTVDIVDLGESLCVLLSGDPATWKGTDPKHTCKGSDQYKATNQLPEGDWCSSTNSASGCKDAWHLVTKFAASAIKIDDGKFNTCK
jgi:hypothetical protein